VASLVRSRVEWELGLAPSLRGVITAGKRIADPLWIDGLGRLRRAAAH
jgi:hypothetical protein